MQTGTRIGLEELAPLRTHGGGIRRPGGPHLLHHPLVGTEAWADLVLRGHVGSPRSSSVYRSDTGSLSGTPGEERRCSPDILEGEGRLMRANTGPKTHACSGRDALAALTRRPARWRRPTDRATPRRRRAGMCRRLREPEPPPRAAPAEGSPPGGAASGSSRMTSHLLSHRLPIVS